MPSSRNSPGIHDRPPGVPRQRCVKLKKNGSRCTSFATTGTKLCKIHFGEVWEEPTPESAPHGDVSKGLKTSVRKNVSNFVITEQAKAALVRLGIANDGKTDAKAVLLDAVRSAWDQSRVWEAMLASIPEEDWAHVGSVPVPGNQLSARGARIEIIQKNLTEATKSAARISKMALDAGIEERMVQLAEEQSALIADTVRAGLIAGIGSLHLSPVAEQAAIAAAVGSAASHLRALAAGEAVVVEGVARRIEKDEPARLMS